MKEGQRVKHIKSDGHYKTRRGRISSEAAWYQKLNNGIVEEVSKTGKSALVYWYDKAGNRIHWGRYPIGNLVMIDKPA